MSPPASPRNSSKAPAPTEGDHRKRRRNRTTQSCLNCHTTKRMCDRARPCSRCTQLGISANCVYEVDDPNRTKNKTKEDEGTRLMNRIAELEGVIRELKNKPRPAQDRSSSASGGTSPTRSGITTPPNTTSWPSPSPSYNSSGSSLHFPSGMGSYPQVAGYPRPSDSLASLMAAYADLTDHMFIRRGGNCGCLNESSCYNAVLELSLRLRKAADVLSRSPSHASHTDCALNTHISELDNFAKYSLLDIPSYDSPLAASFSRGPGFGRGNPPSSPSIFEQPYAENSGSAWNMSDSDSFMSWVPTQRNV
ncbi:hypothetical protein MVEN_00966700 [Mycena venus]|uniref:Zn(2)-C6 fungal-type domain-containing protein n=1 Tax=Mycena venus TaxID=2733690 RepID=A0A8H6YDJ5_9AGAR|nr:hypothetical protein MVEN_00966700 [Mycena venus]